MLTPTNPTMGSYMKIPITSTREKKTLEPKQEEDI